MQLTKNDWSSRVNRKTYLKAIILVLLLATLCATVLILAVKMIKEPSLTQGKLHDVLYQNL